jgi:serine/threonine protein kinase
MKINNPQKSSCEYSRREGEMLASLTQVRVPNIVPCIGHFDLEPVSSKKAPGIDFDFGDGTVHAILMPLLLPDALHMFFQGRAPLSSDDILCIGRLALETLEHLRELGIAHRDLKPENIVYDPNAHELFICDFGAAIKIQPNTKIVSARQVGTRAYRAPELMVGQPYDESVDMWALGATLFELYTWVNLTPITGSLKEAEAFDYFHFLQRNMGLTPREFIELIPESNDGCRGPFRESEKGTNNYQIAGPLSQIHEKAMLALDGIAQLYHSDTQLWKAHIYQAAEKKHENPLAAKRLVDFLQLMFGYTNRKAPEEVLNYFEPADELAAS